MRDYTKANDIEDDSDAVMRQMRAVLAGKLPAAPARRASQRLKGTNLALSIIHSLRGDVRDMGGLSAPEELVLETRQKRRVAMTEPKETIPTEPGPETKALLSVPLIEPEPGPEPELDNEPDLKPETDFASTPLLEREPQVVPEPAIVPKADKLSAGDDEEDDDDGPDEDDDEEGDDDDEPGPSRMKGKSKKLLLKLLKRIATKRKSKRAVRSRKPAGKSRSGYGRRK